MSVLGSPVRRKSLDVRRQSLNKDDPEEPREHPLSDVRVPMTHRHTMRVNVCLR